MFWCPGFNKQALKAGQTVQGWFQRLSAGKLCTFSFIDSEKPISALPSSLRRVQLSPDHVNQGLMWKNEHLPPIPKHFTTDLSARGVKCMI